jgi:hypothetical protein
LTAWFLAGKVIVPTPTLAQKSAGFCGVAMAEGEPLGALLPDAMDDPAEAPAIAIRHAIDEVNAVRGEDRITVDEEGLLVALCSACFQWDGARGSSGGCPVSTPARRHHAWCSFSTHDKCALIYI